MSFSLGADRGRYECAPLRQPLSHLRVDVHGQLYVYRRVRGDTEAAVFPVGAYIEGGQHLFAGSRLSRYCERFRDRDGFPGPSGATSRRRRPSRGHAVRRRSSARSSRRVGGRDPLDRAIRPYRRTLFLRIPSVMGRRREQASFGVVEAARRTSDRGCPSGKRAQSAGIGRECENLPACGTVWMGSEVVCGKSKARARALRPACSQSVMTRRLVGA
jgi:hypothetical protein